MGEFLAVTCDSCRQPMVPNVSTLDADGCLWTCLSPGCPELTAGDLEARDLVEAGVPEALAGRLARLVDPTWTRRRSAAMRRTRSHRRLSGRRPISRGSTTPRRSLFDVDPTGQSEMIAAQGCSLSRRYV